ncbi:MAG: DUF2807 domain-containing protein [Bacteroidales bacterium]|nr:DUF2807 domain-containing protein [Bacteroidales bacterium]
MITRILAAFWLMISVLNVSAQKCVEKKLSSISKIVVADSVNVVLKHGIQNHIAIYGQPEALRTFVSKQKQGVLSIYQTTKGQVFASETPIVMEKNMDIDSVVISTAKWIENISVSNGGTLRFCGQYTPRRLILRLSHDSKAYGNINCEAFGLYVETYAEAYISGQYRTARITADSSKVELSGYQAEVSEFSVTGGSILSASGSTHQLKLEVGGLSRVEAMEMKATNCTANISGRSDAFFNVTGQLKITGRGKSHIIVTGNPKTEADVSGDCKYGRR